MKKLNICIDIDGTVTDPYYFMPYFNKYFDKDLGPEDCHTCKLEDLYEVSLEEVIDFYLKEGYDMHLNAPVLEGVNEILWDLYETHNLYFVTARNKKMEKVTLDWMKANNMPPIKVHSLGSYYKVDKAKELKCDLFIEDNPENTKQLAQEGIKVLLIDTNYNKDLNLKNVIRVNSWYDIKNIIDKMSF
ncbi:5' nucleotidase, NT5C type [Tepidibacter formicigenes]|jgi:uncharacterized HAD superfamily protein|uniref:Nucleotidase n=1 Tax=Tepidibacter formicigenes DSM 15518 TaxID=1123349 RepID=A0A1M6N998_9FIRM|nr:hypothetical protein [Tepidibacter formicigenes]SHJ92310.1 hypothetical protein SAMN02744037_01194 [Tepidibacter formicigenes DSM 15518]